MFVRTGFGFGLFRNLTHDYKKRHKFPARWQGTEHAYLHLRIALAELSEQLEKTGHVVVTSCLSLMVVRK